MESQFSEKVVAMPVASRRSPCHQQPLERMSDSYSETQAVAPTELASPPALTPQKPFTFRDRFTDSMEMSGDAQTVKEYLDAHQGWFCRCAQPMKAEPLENNSYTLVVGRFGAFGYEVEPKIGLELLPQAQGIYQMRTVPVPGYTPSGYQVDYRATLQLIEAPKEPTQRGKTPGGVTRVEWVLDLGVAIHFPRLIYHLPQNAIQKTGDRLLRQIVCQVSRRLTRKVQEDFHTRYGLPLPPAKR